MVNLIKLDIIYYDIIDMYIYVIMVIYLVRVN